MHVLSLFCISLEMMMGTIEGLLDKKRRKSILTRKVYLNVCIQVVFIAICFVVVSMMRYNMLHKMF